MPLESLRPTRGFCLQTAYGLAIAAEAVYESAAKTLSLAVDSWGAQQAEFFDESDTQAVVASNRMSTLVSFRGTQSNSLADWLTDIDADLVPGPMGGEVHVGFYDALSDVWKAIDDYVKLTDPLGRKHLFVTGHSLGGALAMLATARWHEEGRKVSGMYTFGQPRVGDRTFKRNFDFALKPYAFRLVNNNDIVTRLPQEAFGYYHGGVQQYLSDEGLELLRNISAWRIFLDRWKGRFRRLLLGEGIDDFADHSMINYRQRLEDMLETPSSSLLPFTGSPSTQIGTPTTNQVQLRRRIAASIAPIEDAA